MMTDLQFGETAICGRCRFFRFMSPEALQKRREKYPRRQADGKCRRYPPVFMPEIFEIKTTSSAESLEGGPGGGFADGKSSGHIFAIREIDHFGFPQVSSTWYCGEFEQAPPTQAVART